MFQRLSLLALGCLMSVSAFGGQGVLFQYRLVEAHSTSDRTVSDFGFLVDFEKEATADIGGTAKLTMRASDEKEFARLSLSLFDYRESNEMMLVGEEQIIAPYGQKSLVEWKTADGSVYELVVHARRAPTPE